MKTFTILVRDKNDAFIDTQKVKAENANEAVVKCAKKYTHLSGHDDFSYAIKVK